MFSLPLGARNLGLHVDTGGKIGELMGEVVSEGVRGLDRTGPARKKKNYMSSPPPKLILAGPKSVWDWGQ